MGMGRRGPTGLAGLAVAVSLVLAGCGGAGDEAPDSQPSAPAVDTNAPVTIMVGDKPPGEEKELLAEFNRRLQTFTAANPNITVNAEETAWEAETFQALVAGGQLPPAMKVPFTEIRGLIAREQVADLTGYVQPYTDSLGAINPIVAKAAQAPDGRVFGVPVEAYSMGLLYNRELFTEAGLDPDTPPATWQEVRTAAKVITDKTDAQGFQTMSVDNTGGWALTTTSYAFGGLMESEDGATATVDNPAARQVLDLYRQMRWQDKSMGDNFLLNYDDAANAFAGGKVGMYVMGADAYTNMVVNKKMDADAFGLAPLPQADGGLGTLGGGSIYVANPTSTPEQLTAAAKWMDFLGFEKFRDEATATADAEAAAADGTAVGAPGLPILSREKNDRYQGWIAGSVNVPREHFSAYFATVETLPLVPEPPAKAQELYATLDPVVQAVLTREDADIDALLAKAQKTAQSAIEAG